MINDARFVYWVRKHGLGAPLFSGSNNTNEIQLEVTLKNDEQTIDARAALQMISEINEVAQKYGFSAIRVENDKKD